MASATTRIERKPLRPVATHLEEIVEVNESACLEIFNQSRQGVLRWQRSESDEAFSDAEFLIGKVVTRIDGAPNQADPFKCTLPYQNDWPTMTELQGHELDSIRD